MASELSYHWRENDISKHYRPVVVGQNSTVEPSVMSDAIYRNKQTLAHGYQPAILRRATQLAKTCHAIHIKDGWTPNLHYTPTRKTLVYSHKISDKDMSKSSCLMAKTLRLFWKSSTAGSAGMRSTRRNNGCILQWYGNSGNNYLASILEHVNELTVYET